jgi:beta-mannosidase
MADDRRDKEYGNRLIQHYMDTHYRTPKDFESFVYVSQLVQALGVEYAVNAHRRAMPYTMGTLFWQINDCWPAASWSSIDYYGKWKAVHYKARDLYKPVLLIPRLENNELAVYAASDYLDAKKASLVVETFTLNGKQVSRNVVETELPVNTAEKLAVFNMGIKGTEASNNLVVRMSLSESMADAAPVYFHFVEPKDLALPDAGLSLAVKRTGKTMEVTVTTRAFAKNVFVSSPGNLLNFSANYFDLLPGESKTIVAETTAPNITLKATSLRDTY